MSLIGSIIGGVTGAAASIYGGIKSSKAAKQVQKNIQQQLKENQDWYNERINEDATRRADTLRLLQQTEIKRRNQQAAGNSAVMGGTVEAEAAAREANARALSDTMAQIAANAEARKDAIEQQYMSRKANINQQLNDIRMKRAQAISSAAQGVAESASQLGSLFDKE